MDESIALLDTLKKASLQSRSSVLRASLKHFERTFAADNHGRKPGKDAIKANADIAGKYKEYNKIRDVLAGKLTLAALEAPSPSKRKRTYSRAESVAIASPVKQRLQATPRAKRLRPDDIDPYDAPASVTPRRVLSAIGPTPQRDGQVVGIFDLMSNPGSGKGMLATPASRKRKIEALLGDDEDVENQPVVAQTPSQRSVKKAGDMLDHLTGTPVSQLRTSRHKHSRTPISDGKKFMLSQFFATPSAVRYASVAEEHGDPTPLRSRVLGPSPTEATTQERTKDATPAYLRRSYSFKDRLLSASSNPSRDNSSDVDASSPSSARVGPRRVSGKQVKFMPKPLSEIAAEMRKHERKQQDEMHDDDLDAMRDMENEEADVIVGVSQPPVNIPTENDTLELPRKVWKKKGQKRSTRRVIMRPSRLKSSEKQKTTTSHGEPEDEDDPVSDKKMQDMGSEDELHGNPPDDNDDFDENEDFEDEDEGEPYGESKSKASKAKRKKPSEPATKAKGQGMPPKKPLETKKKDTINPNAISHMNFRSLKIKNKNSKAKGRGRGRFGRR